MFYEAIYNPLQTKKIDPLAEKFIGSEIIIQMGWVAKKGKFKGRPYYISGFDTKFIIPENDLENIRPSSLTKWNEFRNNLK